MSSADVAEADLGENSESWPRAAVLPRRISDACWALLRYFQCHNWEAGALDLAHVNPLNYRARISDLRHDFLVQIEPDPPHPPPGVAALYKIPVESRPRVEWLLLHKSLEGFEATPVQKGLFS